MLALAGCNAREVVHCQHFTCTFEESTLTLEGLEESHSFAHHSLSLSSEQQIRTALQFGS